MPSVTKRVAESSTAKRQPAKSAGSKPSRKRAGNGSRLTNATVVVITTVIVLICLVWIFGFRFYAVSSNSMAPTLEGSEDNRDRIVCWMLPGLYRQPRRWEVVIFHTPETAKSQEFAPGMRTGEEQGITIKRLVGLPGERLAIAAGDVWTRPLGGGEFVRQSKPEDVQRNVWISVYDEDFSDVALDEFHTFWQLSGHGVLSMRRGGGQLDMTAGSSIRYKPLSRNVNAALPELPGIPDRYVLPQEALFLCRNCDKPFQGFIRNQKIQGRCPHCDTLNYEDSVAFYGFRSGLPDIGEYSAGDVLEGDTESIRDHPYYFVPDLRVTLQFKPESAASMCEVILSADQDNTTLTIGPQGAAIDGAEISGVSLPAVGTWTEVEFHRADGYVRVYLNGSSEPAYSRMHGTSRKPDADSENRTNGVAVAASGGDMAIRSLAIDRDIHYFSGHRKAVLNYMGRIGADGEIDVPPGAFLPLGDNTTVSFDGRSWGPVNESLLMGTGLAIWKPENRRRLIR